MIRLISPRPPMIDGDPIARARVFPEPPRERLSFLALMLLIAALVGVSLIVGAAFGGAFEDACAMAGMTTAQIEAAMEGRP